MKTPLTQKEVAAQYPAAFAALPECYQADSCLQFWLEGTELYSAPKEGEESVLGNWNCFFQDGEWIEDPIY